MGDDGVYWEMGSFFIFFSQLYGLACFQQYVYVPGTCFKTSFQERLSHQWGCAVSYDIIYQQKRTTPCYFQVQGKMGVAVACNLWKREMILSIYTNAKYTLFNSVASKSLLHVFRQLVRREIIPTSAQFRVGMRIRCSSKTRISLIVEGTVFQI